MNIARRLGWAAFGMAGLIAGGCGSGVAIEPPDPACPASIHLHGTCEPRKASCTVQEGPCSVSYGCSLADNAWAVASTVCTPAAGACSDGEVCETPGDKCANDTAVPCGNFAYCEDDHYWHLPSCDPPGPESCAAHAEAACGADPACRWLVPGCGDPPLPAAGCFALGDCAPDACAPGLVCQIAVYDPCTLAGCAACGADALLCLP